MTRALVNRTNDLHLNTYPFGTHALVCGDRVQRAGAQSGHLISSGEGMWEWRVQEGVSAFSLKQVVISPDERGPC